QTIVRRGHDFTVTTRLGPFQSAWGRIGAQTWQQDENGVTLLDRERPDRVTARTMERVTSPLDAYAVLETYASGHLSRSYYDPRTFVLLRREKWFGGRFMSTVWDDVHPEGKGRVQAWHYDGEDVDGKRFDYRLRSEREGTLADDALLAIPHNRRTLVEFANAQRAARLPARFQHRRIRVRVALNRRSYDFLLDSGASGIILSSEAARQLRLEVFGAARASGAAPVTSGRAIVAQMDIGALRLRDVVVRTAPLGNEERRQRIWGLLGYDFLASCVLRIDYGHGTLDAYENGSVGVPPGATVVDLHLDNRVPETSVRVGDSVGDNFLIDTGAATTVLLLSRFVNAHRADVEDEGVGAVLASSGIGVAANGIGGRIGIRPIQVRRFRFANRTFEDTIIYAADSPHALGLDGIDGLVGADVLSRFTLFLDYANARMMLEPPGSRY
ncbi:MAG: aspartyl protease family protein, partial [Candidatus Eremiobacteraeota bacterium]|nr:aspartyl protease family protein [Candidatus Eremiobacteraeota bacterium]